MIGVFAKKMNLSNDPDERLLGFMSAGQGHDAAPPNPKSGASTSGSVTMRTCPSTDVNGRKPALCVQGEDDASGMEVHTDEASGWIGGRGEMESNEERCLELVLRRSQWRTRVQPLGLCGVDADQRGTGPRRF